MTVISKYFHLQVETVKSGLQASLLVKHPDTGDIYVNFDPEILTLMRETECMVRLGLEVPPVAKALTAKQATLKQNFNILTVSSCLHLSIAILLSRPA